MIQNIQLLVRNVKQIFNLQKMAEEEYHVLNDPNKDLHDKLITGLFQKTTMVLCVAICHHDNKKGLATIDHHRITWTIVFHV